MAQRRGQRKYRLVMEGKPRRLGAAGRAQGVFLKFSEALKKITAMSSRKQSLAVSPVDVKIDHYPQLLPHRITATLLLNYLDPKKAENAVKLSAEKYCSASIMLGKTAEIVHSFEIVET